MSFSRRFPANPIFLVWQWLDDYSLYSNISKWLNFSRNSYTLRPFCEKWFGCCKLTSSFCHFPATSIFLVLQLWKNCAKLLMEFTLYFKPQFVLLKKPKHNRVKSRKNYFVETYLLRLLKSCVLILQFFKIFLLSFVFHYMLITKQDGTTTFKKDLAL